MCLLIHVIITISRKTFSPRFKTSQEDTAKNLVHVIPDEHTVRTFPLDLPVKFQRDACARLENSTLYMDMDMYTHVCNIRSLIDFKGAMIILCNSKDIVEGLACATCMTTHNVPAICVPAFEGAGLSGSPCTQRCRCQFRYAGIPN